MEPEKNLHAKIPPALLAEAENAAQAEHITLDEVTRQAVERYLEDRRSRSGSGSTRWPGEPRPRF
jgi:hypothetical protein